MHDNITHIGSVELDFSFYSGMDAYSDGDVEEELLKICMEGKIDEALKHSKKWPILYHLSPIRENLLDWYPMSGTESVLEIGSGCGAISGLLAQKAEKVTGIELSKRRSLINAYKNKTCSNLKIIVGNFSDIKLKEKYDIITLIGVLEYAALYMKSEEPYVDFLGRIMKYLKPNGKLLIAIENKMGLKYLNGANEDHTGKAFSGINDYAFDSDIRTFSKNELEDLLACANVKNMRFYYPLPDYKLPEVIYSDGCMPSVSDVRFYKNNYDANRMYLYNEAIAFDQLCKDGKFDYFANSFLLEVNPNDEEFLFAKYSRERRKEYKSKTFCKVIDGEKYVIKEPIDVDSQSHITSLVSKGKKLQFEYRNLLVHKGEICEDTFKYKFLPGVRLDKKFYSLRYMPDRFIEKLDELIKFVYDYNVEYLVPFRQTDEFKDVFGIQEIKNTKSLKYTNIDALFHNMIEYDDKIYVIDYEWVFDFPIPINFVVWRNIKQLYATYRMYIKQYFSLSDLEKHFGIDNDVRDIYKSMESNFCNYVFGKNNEELYKSNYIKAAFSPTVNSLY